MKELVVHLGSYKTGSSAVQNAFYAKRNPLFEDGVLYPSSGLYFAEPEVGVRHTPLVYSFFEKPEVWERESDKLLEEVAETEAEVIVLSSEAWSTPSYIDSLSALIQKFRDAMTLRTRGIIFFRNRLQYARSVYREFSYRRGTRAPFRKLVSGRRAMFDYAGLLRRYHATFDSTDVIDYHSVRSAEKEVFDRIGTKVLPESRRQNPGITAAEAEAARLLNRLALEEPVSKEDRERAILYALEGVDASRFCEFGGEEILEPSERDVERFAKLSGLDERSCERLYDVWETDKKDIETISTEIEDKLRTALTLSK